MNNGNWLSHLDTAWATEGNVWGRHKQVLIAEFQSTSSTSNSRNWWRGDWGMGLTPEDWWVICLRSSQTAPRSFPLTVLYLQDKLLLVLPQSKGLICTLSSNPVRGTVVDNSTWGPAESRNEWPTLKTWIQSKFTHWIRDSLAPFSSLVHEFWHLSLLLRVWQNDDHPNFCIL